jgi:hypothetical protein
MNRSMIFQLLALLLPVGLMRFSVEGGDGGGAPTPPAPADGDHKETFSREYVRELREENKGWRQKATALETERDTHKTAAERFQLEADDKVKAASAAANDRILRSELKAEALKAGMIDLDGLKLADLSKVTLKEDGTVDGAESMLEELKKAKPYLFGSTQNSSTPGTPPNPKPPTAKKATEMTTEEYAIARKQFK